MDLLGQGPETQRLREMISSPHTLGTVMHAICLRAFGTDMYEWEPEALAMEIRDEFGVEASAAGLTRLNALISGLVSDSVYRDWIAFAAVCSGLCTEDGEIDLDGFIPSAVAAWGVIELLLNDDTPGTWSPEVARYVGTILAEDGFVKAPGVLAWADMPSIYHGSDSGGDLGQQQALDTQHKAVVDEFIEEQSLLLFKQLAFLPWMTREKLESLAAEIRL